jgi:hypothetical protein
VDDLTVPAEATTRQIPVESSSRPGVVYGVDLAKRTCTCPATVETCRHIRQALIRRRKQLARLEEQYRSELMDDEERLELYDVILRLRRSLRQPN